MVRFVLIAGLLLSIVSHTAHATTIVQAGSQLDIGDGLRSTDVPKTLDGDGDNVYGSDGYLFPNTDPTVPPTGPGGSRGPAGTGSKQSLPAYITGRSNASGREGYGGYGYKAIDDPALPPGAAVSNITSGIGGENQSTGLNTVVPLYNFTLSSNAGDFPANGFRVGVLVNQTGGQDFPEQLRVTSASGDSEAMAVATGLSANSMYFVDVVNPTPGETLTVRLGNLAASGKGIQKAYIGGVTFDSLSTPTPMDYGDGFVWNRNADYSIGFSGGSTAGNPTRDANGNRAWRHEYITDSDNDGLVGGSPWYEAPASLMQWDNKWFSSTSGLWAVGDDTPARISDSTFEHTLDNATWIDTLPLARWTNPTGEAISVDLTGEVSVGWDRNSQDDIEFILASVADATGVVTPLVSDVFQFGDGPLAIDVSDVALAPDDQIIYGIRGDGTTGYVTLNDTGLSLILSVPTGVIPEPSALLVWSLLGAVGVGAAWRRRKR